MNSRRARKRRRCLRLLALALLAAAALLTGHNVRESRRAGEAAAAAVARLREVLPVPAPTAGPSARPPGPSPAPPEPDGLPAAEPETGEPPAEAAETVELGGFCYLGILSLPALELELPVIDRCSDAGLKQAPCRYTGAPETGDLVIAGHNYRSHFGALGSLSPGDAVRFTGVDGGEYAYAVASVETLSPWQLREATGAGWELTLLTCTPSGRARLAVRCAAAS